MKIMTLICMVFIFSSCSNLEKSLEKAIAYGSIQELNNINPKVEKNLLVRLYESPIYSENCFKETHGICHYRYFLSVSTFDEYPEVNIYNIKQVGEISEIKWLNKQSSDYAEIKFTFNKYTKAALNNNSSLKNKIEDILVKLTPIKYIEEKYSANNTL